MAQLSDLIPLVQDRCQGVLVPLAQAHLEKSYRKFCIQSGYATETELLTKDGDGKIELVAPHGYYVLAVNYIDDKDTELEKGRDYSISAGNVITLSSSYTTVSINYSIAPTFPIDGGLEAIDEVFNLYADAIADGAASTLTKLPNMNFSDRAESDYYERKFTDGYRDAYQKRIEMADGRHLENTSKRVFI